MVKYISEGDIFKIEGVNNYAHGCNCAGAMGKGIALVFRAKYPQMYNKYKGQPIICLGRSPKWFLNTSLWMKDGIDGYDFVAFS